MSGRKKAPRRSTSARTSRKTGKVKTTLVDGKGSGRVRIHDKTAPVKAKSIVTRSELSLALLSPYRFPMLNEASAGTVARYAGVFFVVVGGIFSLLNIHYATGLIAGEFSQTAQVITNGSTTTSTGTANVDPKPLPRVTVEGGTTLGSMGVVMVTVPYATEVKLLAERKGDQSLLTLGNMFKVDASTWRFYWQTSQYPDGEYMLRTIIRNEYGSYEYKDPATYLVNNVPDENAIQTPDPAYYSVAPEDPSTGSAVGTTTEGSSGVVTDETASGTSSATVPAEPEEPEERAVNLHIGESSPLTGDVAFRAVAENADGLKVYARNMNSGVLYFVGSMNRDSVGEWRLVWNSKLVPDGNYAFRAKAAWGSFLLEGDSISRKIANGTAPLAPLASSTGMIAAPGTSTATSTFSLPADDPAVLEPTIALAFSKDNPLTGFVDIVIETSPVSWVELFAVPKNSMTPFFLGLGQKSSDTKWKYTWQTNQTPNGDYRVYARVKTNYGFTEGKRYDVSIRNDVVTAFSKEEEQILEKLADAKEATAEPTDDAAQSEMPRRVYIEPVSTFVMQMEAEDNTRQFLEERLSGFRRELNVLVNDLARAQRMEDDGALEEARRKIENLKSEVLHALSGELEEKELLGDIDAYLSKVAFELEELTAENERVLKDRVGDAIMTDSDKDGITDYDEVNLYRTNPFAADTDGDSYIDSVEIRLGYDPHDAESEALVAYESPKEVGIVREDLLVVDTITTLGGEEEIEDAPKRALISGKGLPNSFVTLYIYSTPIILTVKTDAEGNWSYVFDKELEDGDHEVYVGLTDNTGRIVAKSNPLPFVKTAVAYATEDSESAALPVEVEKPSLIGEKVLILIGSLAVVGLGLVLILLGLHVHGRPKGLELIQQA